MTTTAVQPEKLRSRAWSILPLLLAALVYLLATTGRGVIDYDEGYYAQAAKNMAVSGDWVTPYVNGVRFLEKPPFLYWLTAASFKIFGINEFALRLPTALAVIALVWVMMRMARRVAGEKAALIAGLCTAFSVGTFLFTRETLHDVWLVLFIALAMCGFLEWQLDPRRPLKPALLFYAASAGAVMCKSLVGLAFPVGIVIVFFLLSRERPSWRSLHVLPGTLLFLVLTVPWHWLAALRNEGFLEFFFVTEQFLRFFGRREPPVLWSLPLAAFWGLVLVWMFPWTAFLPGAIVESWKSEDPKRRILLRLSAAWAGVILGFFSLSDRLEHYAFPALPALALLIAATLAGSRSKWTTRAFAVLAAFGIAAMLAGLGAGAWLAAHGMNLSAAGPTNRLAETDFSILAEMPPGVAAGLLKPAAATAAALGIGFAAALWFELRRQRIKAVACVAAVMMAVCGAVHWSLGVCEDLISSKRFALAVAGEARAGDRLVIVGDYESANSLSFYTSLPVQICGGVAYALVPGMKFPDSPKIVISRGEFQEAWQSARRVYALVPRQKRAELNPGGVEVLSLLHRVLIRNH